MQVLPTVLKKEEEALAFALAFAFGTDLALDWGLAAPSAFALPLALGADLDLAFGAMNRSKLEALGTPHLFL